MVKVSAPGKLILSGEHAVVYGHPALVTAIDRRLEITAGHIPLTPKSEFIFRIETKLHELLPASQNLFISSLSSQIPIGSGLGSSAAIAVAASAAFSYSQNHKLDLSTINEIAHELEKLHNKNDSGADATICTHGGFIWYVKESEQKKTFTPHTPKINLPEFLLIHSGTPKETTGELVQMVRQSLTDHPKKFSPILLEISAVTHEFRNFLYNSSSTPLSQLITANERLLEALGVVSLSTQDLIRQIEKLGGSAKISGAGGLSDGSGILLTYHPDLKVLQNFAIKHHLEYFRVKLGTPGVQLEESQF